MVIIKALKRSIIYVPVTIISFIMAIPFIWLIFITFKSNNELFNNPFSLPDNFNFGNYKTAIEIIKLPLLFKNTFILLVFTLFFGLVINFMSSYALSRMFSKLSRKIYYLFLSGLAVPIYILLFPIYIITIKLQLVGTYASLILPYIAGGISFNILLFVGHLKAFPIEIEEAAIVDGCGLMRLLFSIVIPVLKPVFVTVLLFNFLGIWNEFPVTSILVNNDSMLTVSLAASLFRGRYSVDYTAMSAGVVILMLPQVLVFIIFQKYIIGGMVAGAVKG